ncbi:uncharacterized protein Triagg1_4627 [Trichoderma aggressivum f. europaeum]|uniref:Uncharacterized protein n=1 Tax=Trichoderma aggressivum f. europaeum TaxID=173218 RepID=A0AAE1J7X6_9HYPO|nr:hypothetical protein Triagg1_4627 [Trichoderma aggressivum f. europaeum]
MVGSGNTFEAHMEAFSKRNLTYEVDVLNAFRGVLNRQPWRSFWGIPLPTRSWWVAEKNKASALAIDDSSVDTMENQNLSPNAAFAGGLAWQKRSSESERRRKGGFPTWCWASTLGKVIWRQKELGVDGPRRVLDYARFQIDEGGRHLSLSDFIASHPDAFVLPQTTHRLLVIGHIVQFRLFRIQGGQFIAQDIGSKFDLARRLWSVPFDFDVDSEIPELKEGYEKPFPALILLVDDWSAKSFEKRRLEAEYDDEDNVDDEDDEDTGRTFLLLLNWDGEVAQRRALIEIESGLLVGATKEEKIFELS